MLTSSDSATKTSNVLLRMVTPSALSGLLCTVTAIGLVGNLLLTMLLRGSYLPVVVFEWANLPAFWQEGDLSYDMAWDGFAANAIIFVLWAALGLAIVSLIRWAMRTRARLKEAKEDLQTVGYNRWAVFKQELVRVGFRLLAVAAWVAYWWLFFEFILRYIINATIAASANLADPQNVGFTFVALLTTALSLHLHVVFARFSALRPRLFGA